MEQSRGTRSWQQIILDIFAKAEKDKEYADRKINANWYINFITNCVLPDELKKDREFRSRRQLVAVIERISLFSAKYKFDVSFDDKQTIGKAAKEIFLSNPLHKYIATKQVDEGSGVITVLAYPSFFVPVIDALIVKHYRTQTTNTHST